jgi:hypothetical protein
MEKQEVLHSLDVCLQPQLYSTYSGCDVSYFYLWLVCVYYTLSHYLIYNKIFWRKILNIKYTFWNSLQFSKNVSNFNDNLVRIVINVHWSLRKHYSCHVKKNSDFLNIFSENTKIKNIREFFQWEQSIYADRGTDGEVTKLIVFFFSHFLRKRLKRKKQILFREIVSRKDIEHRNTSLFVLLSQPKN